MKLLKKILSSVTAIALTAGLTAPDTAICISAESQENLSSVWSGEADTSWYDGEQKSYDIHTAEQLAGLSALVADGNSMQGIVINLTSDIILNDTSNIDNWEETPPMNIWTPIGTPEGNAVAGYRPFAGVFNGNGYSISGMYTVTEDSAGLFGYIYCGGVFRLMIKDSYVRAEANENTSVDILAGGIAGLAEGSIINECSFDGKVYAIGVSELLNGDHSSYAGGIVGAAKPYNASAAIIEIGLMGMGYLLNPVLLDDGHGGVLKATGIANCISKGYVYSECFSTACTGGIIGYAHKGLISDCIDLASIKVKNGYLGAIAGMLFSCEMENCYYSYSTLNQGVGMLEYGGEATDTATNLHGTGINAAQVTDMLGNAYTYLENAPDGNIHLKADKHISDLRISLSGDVNHNGVFSVSDIVIFRKWLSGTYDVSLEDWQAADLCNDGILNIYDLILMKKALLAQ